MRTESDDQDIAGSRVSRRAADLEQRNGVIRGVRVGIGLTIALVGASLLAIAAVGLLTGGDGRTAPATSVGLMVVFGAMIWWGVQIGWPELGPRPLARRLLVWRAARRTAIPGPVQPPAPDVADPERAVLRLAEREHGRLTVLDVAAGCDLTAEEARALLDSLVLKQTAHLHVSDSGVLVYVFPELLSRSGRRRWG